MKIKISYRKFIGLGKKLLKQKKTQKVGKIAGLVVLGLAIFYLIFNLSYQNKIFPKTYIGSTNFGGQTREEAKATLAKLIETSKDSALSYAFGEKSYTKKAADLNVDYQSLSDQTVDNLFKVGKDGSVFKILGEQLKSIFGSNHVAAAFKVDDQKLNDFLGEIARSIDKEEHDATIGFKNTEPYVEPEVVGQKFEVSVNKPIILDSIGQFSFDKPMPFVVDTITPKITTKMAEKALEKTKELLNRHLKITARGKTYEIKSEDIPGLLAFEPNEQTAATDANSLLNNPNSALVPQFSAQKVGVYVDKIAGEVNQEAKNPEFKVENGRVATFQMAQTGYELQKETSVKAIISALNEGSESIELEVKKTDPAISSSDPAAAGITEMIGEGKTSWRGSPKNRIHNLTLGATRISGTIVSPGQEFSTVKSLGEIDASGGYLPELVIKNSTKVVPDYGGGLCQVSTTLFRSVLNSGLKITARTNHSFRVSYYEPPVGMDATIYDPAPDFRFVNTMNTPILIWAIPGSNTLTFQIYGTKDGRQIEVGKPAVGNYVSPPGPVYTQSDTMAPGTVRQVEKALSGCTASFTYKVTAKDGSILENQTFTSKYVALPDSFLYGAGYVVPGSAPAPTPPPAATPTPTPTPSS